VFLHIIRLFWLGYTLTEDSIFVDILIGVSDDRRWHFVVDTNSAEINRVLRRVSDELEELLTLAKLNNIKNLQLMTLLT